MSDEERAALVDIVMDANPEIYGKMVNDESGQYFSESDRQSLSNDSTLREERLNTIIYAGDKINIPTINPKIKEDSVKITQAAQSNDPEEHVHVGTVIATPHGTQEFVYTPNSDTAIKNKTDNGEELVWVPLDEIAFSYIKPDFIRENITKIIKEKTTIHIIEERDR